MGTSGIDRMPEEPAQSLFSLAVPMVISRAGLASMAIIDCIMVARYDARQLAMAVLAEGTFGRLADVFLAFILGGLVLFAAAQGTGNRARRIALWHRSLAVAVVLGAVGLAASLFSTPVLDLMGQERLLSAGAGPVIAALGIGLPAGLVAIASAVYLEGSGKANRVAIFILVANVVNLAVNWLLIGGNLGVPELGALGSAISTTLVRFGLAVALVIAVWSFDGPAVFRRAATGAPLKDKATNHKGGIPDQWTLGLTAAATAFGMHACGLWLTIFAGWLGALPLAAFASGWVLNLPGMLLAIGIGDAMAMRVARQAVVSGEGTSMGDIAKTVRGDMLALTLVLAPFAIALIAAPAFVAGLYTTDLSLQTTMIGLLPASGLVLLLDGVGYGALAALRGRRDVTVPMAIQIVTMAATPIVAGGLAFGLGMGLPGLVWAIPLTSAVRLVLLMLRLFNQFSVLTALKHKPEREPAWT